MNHQIYFLAALLIFWPAAPGLTQSRSRHAPGVRRDDGTRRGYYYNCGFGYAFSIPKGLIGRGSPDGSPQHGVAISLPGRPESYVWVDGSFSDIDWRTPEDAATSYQEALGRRAKDVSRVETQATRLGRLPALRLTFSYRTEGVEDRFTEEVILARRGSKREAEITYTIGLKTSGADYKEVRRLREHVLRTFQLKPLPCA